MSDWTELQTELTGTNRDRIRYRERTSYEGAPLAFDLEVWHPNRQEWREVNSLQARDWFVLGYLAGQPQQQELFGGEG